MDTSGASGAHGASGPEHVNPKNLEQLQKIKQELEKVLSQHDKSMEKLAAAMDQIKSGNFATGSLPDLEAAQQNGAAFSEQVAQALNWMQ